LIICFFQYLSGVLDFPPKGSSLSGAKSLRPPERGGAGAEHFSRFSASRNAENVMIRVLPFPCLRYTKNLNLPSGGTDYPRRCGDEQNRISATARSSPPSGQKHRYPRYFGAPFPRAAFPLSPACCPSARETTT